MIDDRLEPQAGERGLFRRVLKITGRTESDVDAAAQPVYAQVAAAPIPICTTILAVMGQIELHLTADAPSRRAADAALDAAVEELLHVLGPSVYSTDGRPLEAVVGDLLREARLTIAVAESCTGGLLASRLTDVPGSSDYFERGVVCYSNRAKTEWLGVPDALIAAHGAVSEPVARRWPRAFAIGRIQTSASASPASPARAAGRPRSRSARSPSPSRRRRSVRSDVSVHRRRATWSSSSRRRRR